MTRKISIIFAILLITACNQQREQTKEVLSPKKLKANESLVVNFTSEGCFHNQSNLFVFQDNNVTIYDTSSKKKRLGTVILTSTDKEGLKDLFSYYNSDLKGDCTTQETIEIKQYKAEKLISSKKIIDGTCGRHQRGVYMSFYELLERVKEKSVGEE